VKKQWTALSAVSIVAALLFAGACDSTAAVDTGAPIPPTGGDDAGPVATSAQDDGGGVAATVDARAAATLYPFAVYKTRPPVTFMVTYPNVVAGRPGVTSAERTIGIAVYRPMDAPMPAPVVILAHGGGEGVPNPLNAMEDWAPVVAQAGFVAVSIAFRPRTPAELTAICEMVGNVDVPCGVALSWDRPSDLGAVLDFLQAKANDDPVLAGQLDVSRVATLSHSAGSGAMEFVGGMTTSYKCMRPFGKGQHDCQVSDLVSRRDPRVKAIALMSPQGPDGFGFIVPNSFQALAVPMLIATGVQDNTGDLGEAENRKKLFDLVPPGDRFLMWITTAGSRHSFFNHQVDECTTETSATRCATMQTWLEATTFAFLDYQLRGSTTARDWLRRADLTELSNGEAILSSK
jgi:predicted dienelactone hydrolase